MRTPSLGAFFSKTNLLRWMINLLLLPPAATSATAYAQGGWQLVSHSRVAHQDDDVAEKLKSSPSPSARVRSFEQLPFCFIIKPKMSPMLLNHFDLRSVANHLPLLRFVEHSSQGPQSAVGISGRAWKFQLLGAIASDLVHFHLNNGGRLQQPPAVTVELSRPYFQPGGVHPS